ncbi:PREDICTED: leukocyte cell-derived chemotaxin 1-like, partial [Nestor notabilis]|uniref:leukocyte cell-derived chemotaxin 1-like n=1 Tax=Nestor notabilis TaxID=176057 RepID=UPI000523CDEE
MGLLVACTGEVQLGNASCEIHKEVFKQILKIGIIESQPQLSPYQGRPHMLAWFYGPYPKGVLDRVYNVHYTMSINGKVQDGSMEIDAGNNLETFKTGSGSEEAVEVHDFQIGITGIRFAEGEKCYIKAQPKAHVPEVDAMTKASLSSDLEDEIMPVRFDENSLIWVAADEPIKHNSFLSPKILELCGDLPIFWLRPTYPK